MADASRIDEKDPFEIFARGHGSGSIRDPHTHWAELRASSAVNPGGLDGDPGKVHPLFGGRPAFTVFTHDAVCEILSDTTRFSTSIMDETIGSTIGHVMVAMDGAEHRAHRSIVQQVFSRRAMESWERTMIVPIVEEHIDQFASRGYADLVRELTLTFPVHVIGALLGLPAEDLPNFHRWSVEMLCLAFDPELGILGSQRLAEYFRPLVAERRRDPRDDVISKLTSSELDGHALDDETIVSFLRFLLEAGAETTYRSTSNLFCELLHQPDVLAEVRDDRSLVPAAVEEAIRFEPPLTGIIRVTTQPATVCGVVIPEGALVTLNIGAAGRDETRWRDPDAFDIHRESIPHASFGHGVHLCLGMHLARAEMAVALNAVLDRLPNLRLDPAAEDVYISGETFRAPEALPVLFG